MPKTGKKRIRKQKPRSRGYWTKERLLSELRPICKELGRIPVKSELYNRNLRGLAGAIHKYGGREVLAKELGVSFLTHNLKYWTWERLEGELKPICKRLKRFPTKKNLREIKKVNLSDTIRKFGGFRVVAKKMGYKPNSSPFEKWTPEKIENDLRLLIDKYGYIPGAPTLGKEGKTKLLDAIKRYGGMALWAKKMKARRATKPTHYWTWDNMKKELKPLIEKYGRFPTCREAKENGVGYIFSAIHSFGGAYAIAKRLGVETCQKPSGYWTLDRIIEEIISIADEVGRFPTQRELYDRRKSQLVVEIRKYGGLVNMAMTIYQYVEEGKLPRKWYFASRLSRGTFFRLNKKMKIELMREDLYYGRMERPERVRGIYIR